MCTEMRRSLVDLSRCGSTGLSECSLKDMACFIDCAVLQLISFAFNITMSCARLIANQSIIALCLECTTHVLFTK